MKPPSIKYHEFKKDSNLEDSIRLVRRQDYVEAHGKDPIHRHTFFELQFVWQGSGEQSVDFQKLEVRKSNLLLIRPNQIHQADKALFEDIDVIVFNPEYLRFMDSLKILQLSSPNIPKQIQLSNSSTTIIKQYLQLLNIEYTKMPNRMVLQGLLMAILGHLDRLFVQSFDEFIATDERIALFLRLLEKDFKRHHKTLYYASELNLSVKHLNNIISKELGKSAAAIIRDRITLEIKRLLSYSNKTQKEIAYELGFTDPHYMSHFFKGQTGIRPSQFKV